jgi:hypothetical protein
VTAWLVYVAGMVAFMLYAWRRQEAEYLRGYRAALDHVDEELRRGNGYEAREIVSKLRGEIASPSSSPDKEGGNGS